MIQIRICFGVKLLEGGKLRLIGFLSQNERKEFCELKENHTRPITMKQWENIPKSMKE